ncbi:hypothetical protein RI367_007696 [Sorochytrium milnesiophthora]
MSPFQPALAPRLLSRRLRPTVGLALLIFLALLYPFHLPSQPATSPQEENGSLAGTVGPTPDQLSPANSGLGFSMSPAPAPLHEAYDVTETIHNSSSAYVGAGLESPFLPTSDFGQQMDRFTLAFCANTTRTQQAKPSAVGTLLSSDQYIIGAQVLGYSLKLVNTTVPMLLFYLENTLSDATLCKARAAGWTPRAVRKLPNPPGKDPPKQYQDQFTKLRAWELEEYAHILMIDSDAYVRHPVQQIFCLDAPFAMGDTFFTGFNNGVSYLSTSKETFESMVVAMKDTTKYDVYFAEQAFLWAYWKDRRHVRLPYSWNVDLNLYLIQQNWPQLWDERIIVHFTRDKPWNIRDRKPNSDDHRPWEEWYRLERQFLDNPRVNGAQCEGSPSAR